MISPQQYTLIVPTYNRPVLLNGLLTHLAAKGSSFPIHVLDSSGPADRNLNRKIVEKHQPHVEHVVFEEGKPFQNKLVSHLPSIRTPYVSLCADDDLLFPEVIEDCIEQLDRAPDTVGCHGVYLNLTLSGDRARLYVEYDSASIDAGDVVDRMIALLLDYQAITYAVYRSAHFAATFARAEQVVSPYYWELFAGLAAIAGGKMKRLPRVSNIRRTFLPYPETVWHPVPLMADDPDKFMGEFVEYRRRLLEFLADHNIFLNTHGEKRITHAHLVYFLDTIGGGGALKGVLLSRLIGAEHFHRQHVAPTESHIVKAKPLPQGAEFAISAGARAILGDAMLADVAKYCQSVAETGAEPVLSLEEARSLWLAGDLAPARAIADQIRKRNLEACRILPPCLVLMGGLALEDDDEESMRYWLDAIEQCASKGQGLPEALQLLKVCLVLGVNQHDPAALAHWFGTTLKARLQNASFLHPLPASDLIPEFSMSLEEPHRKAALALAQAAKTEWLQGHAQRARQLVDAMVRKFSASRSTLQCILPAGGLAIDEGERGTINVWLTATQELTKKRRNVPDVLVLLERCLALGLKDRSHLFETAFSNLKARLEQTDLLVPLSSAPLLPGRANDPRVWKYAHDAKTKWLDGDLAEALAVLDATRATFLDSCLASPQFLFPFGGVAIEKRDGERMKSCLGAIEMLASAGLRLPELFITLERCLVLALTDGFGTPDFSYLFSNLKARLEHASLQGPFE